MVTKKYAIIYGDCIFFKFNIEALHRDWETYQPKNTQLFMVIAIFFIFKIKAFHRDCETCQPKNAQFFMVIVYFFEFKIKALRRDWGAW